ncbi:MAG: helix-turn-helix transcriptional regulator [Deferribacterales bacterium]
MEQKFLKRIEVEKITGLSRSLIYELMNTNEFPHPVKLTKKSVRWVKAEIDEWCNEKIQDRNTRQQ